jgi:hypothetical protein
MSPNEWEQIQRGRNTAIKTWIDNSMQNCSCAIVLIGEETYKSEWVKYEIKKAWNENKGLFGIYIHNLKCPKNGKSLIGLNPFDYIKLPDGAKLSSVKTVYDQNPPSGQKIYRGYTPIITVHNPLPNDAYNNIENNIESWIEKAISDAKNRHLFNLKFSI